MIHNAIRRLRPEQQVWLAATTFTLAGLLLQWWRIQTLNASMDQGILFQVLWNGLHGHPFESTLSSQLSTNVVHGGQLPAVGYHRLGQHFTPTLLLWLPLIGLLGIWALPCLQIALISAAGLVLHQLARQHLEPHLAARLALSFYGANAVIGPALGNFTDLSQLPLCFFLLLLGLQQRRAWLIAIPALLMPLIREDTGLVLLGVGLWLLIRHRRQWPLAAALMTYGAGWAVVATNVLMPLFSEDNSRRFMVENFGQYLQGRDQASSLSVASLVLQQPLLLLRELVSPPGQTITYLAGQGLPLMFIPFIAADSWLLMGLPLLGLLLAQGSNNPLSINIRYTYLVVPGLFAGAMLWWQRNSGVFHNKRLRILWSSCIVLSLLFTLTSNPNRSLSWLIPDSVQPWVYRSPWSQFSHGRIAQRLLQTIPAEASVSASTPLIPQLAARKVLLRFPQCIDYVDREGKVQPVEWVAVDLDGQKRMGPAFRSEARSFKASMAFASNPTNRYEIQSFADGIALFERDGISNPEALKELNAFRMLSEATARPSSH